MTCECEKSKQGCGIEHPYDKVMRCSRDKNHKGKHFACGTTHKIYEW